MKLTIGRSAPHFTLPDQEGKEHDLSTCKGQWVLLYFYPRDNTPGCTIEACTIRDSYPAFQKLHAKVFGISADSVQSHTKFATKYELPFTLLSNESKEMLKAYGAWGRKKFMGREYDGIYRMSVLIDPEGKVAKVYDKVKPSEHAEEVLQDLQKFGKQ